MDTIESRENLRLMNFNLGGAFATYAFLEIFGLEVLKLSNIQPFVMIICMIVLLFNLFMFSYFLMDWLWRYTKSDLMEITMNEFASWVRKVFRK